MSFVKPGPLVGYVTGDVIDEADINYWCSKLPDCIDGAGGGTYNLSAPLSILGDTVTLDDAVIGNLEVTNDLEVADDAILNGALTVNSYSTFIGSVEIANSLRFRFETSFGPNADTTFTPADAGQIVFVETLSANRAYTLSGSFTAGAWFLFKHRAAGGSTLTVNGSSYVLGEGALWVYNGTLWRTFKFDAIT